MGALTSSPWLDATDCRRNNAAKGCPGDGDWCVTANVDHTVTIKIASQFHPRPRSIGIPPLSVKRAEDSNELHVVKGA